LRLYIDGTERARGETRGEFEISGSAPSSGEPTHVEIVSDSPPGWAASKGDDRDLAFRWNELRALH